MTALCEPQSPISQKSFPFHGPSSGFSSRCADPLTASPESKEACDKRPYIRKVFMNIRNVPVAQAERPHGPLLKAGKGGTEDKVLASSSPGCRYPNHLRSGRSSPTDGKHSQSRTVCNRGSGDTLL